MGLFSGGDEHSKELKELRNKGAWDELATRAYREITPFSEAVEEIYRRDAGALHSRMYGPLRGFVYSIMLPGFQFINNSSEKDKYAKWPKIEEFMREEGFALMVSDKVKFSLAEKISGPIAPNLIREARQKYGVEIAKKVITILESEAHAYKDIEKKRLAEKADYKSLTGENQTFDDFTNKANETLQKIEEQVNAEFEALKNKLYDAFQKLDSVQYFDALQKLGLNRELAIYGYGTGSLLDRLEHHKDVDSGVGSELIKACMGKSEPCYRTGRLFYDEARDRLLLILRKANDELEVYATSRGANLADTAKDYLYHITKSQMTDFSQQLRQKSELKSICVQIFDDSLANKGATPAPYQLEQPKDDKGFRNMYRELTFELQALRGKISDETIGHDDAQTELARIRKEYARMKSQDGQHKDVNYIEENITDTANAIQDLL